MPWTDGVVFGGHGPLNILIISWFMRGLRAVATSGGSGEGALCLRRWSMENLGSIGVLLDAMVMARGPGGDEAYVEVL